MWNFIYESVSEENIEATKRNISNINPDETARHALNTSSESIRHATANNDDVTEGGRHLLAKVSEHIRHNPETAKVAAVTAGLLATSLIGRSMIKHGLKKYKHKK